MSPRPISRPLVWAGPGALAGVHFATHDLVWLAAGSVTLLLLWGLTRREPRAWLLLAAAGAGFLAGTREHQRARRDLAILVDTDRQKTDVSSSLGIGSSVLKVEQTGEDPLRDRAWLRGRNPEGVGVLCAWPGPIPRGVGPGAWVRVAGRFRVPQPPGNPGEADAQVRLASSGASIIADLRNAANLTLLSPAPVSVRAMLESARRRAALRLRELLPPRSAALACALLLGIRSGLEERDRLRFERTGTLHLLAISGMHLLILAGLLHRLLRLIGLGPRWTATGALIFVLAYLPLTGGAAPIRRAATMATCYAIALIRGRPADGASALGGAALLLALLDPLDVHRVGFRLSFTAVLGIHWLAPAWRARWSERTRLLRRFPVVRRERWFALLIGGHVGAALPVALAAWLATSPWIAHEFGVVNPWAPLANLAAAPIVTLLLPMLALLALGIDALAPAVVVLHSVLDAALDGASRLPGALVVLPPVPALSVCAWCLGCYLLRLRAAPAAACFCLATILLLLGAVRDAGPRLVLFDVGHGQAALVRLGDGMDVLVDAGSHGRPRLARRVLFPALRNLGVRRLEAIVCTHADADHWNAIPSLLARFPVGRLVVDRTPAGALLKAAARHGVPVEQAREGRVVVVTPRASLSVLATGPPPPANANDRSIALVLQAGPWRALLPADREEEGLQALLVQRPGQCQVLVAPHHGRPCASAKPLGRAVRPTVLLASCRWQGTDLDAMADYGAQETCTTARDGCLTVEFPASARAELEVQRFRAER